MWNHVIFRLGIRIEKKDQERHLTELSLLNEWFCNTYAEKLTCEEVVIAYNLACTRKLPIDELFSLLNPKHVGIVLDAYLRWSKDDLEINRVFKQQLLLDVPTQTPEQINEFMESALLKAIDEVREGKFYYDHGNGVFDWLLAAGRIEVTEDLADEYYQKGIRALPKLLEREKTLIPTHDTPKRILLDKLLHQLESRTYGEDHEQRIQAHAKRLFLNDHLKTLL